MAHTDAYAEFSRLQHRYCVCFIRLFALGVMMVILAFGINALGPSYQYFHILTFCCGVAFVITWFQTVATYFRAMNWRCPDCQHRFAGLLVGRALMN